MAAFIEKGITNAGKTLIAKGQLGTQINFTEIIVGDGEVAVGTEVADLTDLIHPVMTLPIDSMKINNDQTVTLRSIMADYQSATGFYYREIGIKAQDPDVGEILYAYGNTGAQAEWIPASGGSDIVEKIVQMIIAIGNADNVTANMQSGIYVLQSQLEEELAAKIDKVPGKGLSSNDYTTVEKEKLAGLANYDDTAVIGLITTAQTTANTANTTANAATDDMTAHKIDYVRQPAYAATAGSLTAYTVTITPTPSAVTTAGFGITIVPHVDCGASPTLKINTFTAAGLRKDASTPFAAGELKAGVPYTFRRVGSYFLASSGTGEPESLNGGTGADGALSAGATLVPDANGVVVKQYTSLTLPAGSTITTSVPCNGLIIYVQGNCVINGTIDMSKKASAGSVNGMPPLPFIKDTDELAYNKILSTILPSLVSLKGGAGGNGGAGYSSITGGTGGAGRYLKGGYGGGGGGGTPSAGAYYGGVGGSISHPDGGGGTGAIAATTTSGGGVSGNSLKGTAGISGGGGTGVIYYVSGQSVPYGANGGDSFGGGGGGSSGTYGTYAIAGGNGEYAGGFVALVVGGNLTISATGAIKTDGGAGGYGGGGNPSSRPVASGTWIGGGGGGGGSGGGVVLLLYKGTYSNAGSITANGGAGGVGGANCSLASPQVPNTAYDGATGNAGSVGTILTKKLLA